MGDLIQFPVDRIVRMPTGCEQCGDEDIQGTYGGRRLCPACSQADRPCHWCREVAVIGLSTRKVEICFPCCRKFLLLDRKPRLVR